MKNVLFICESYFYRASPNAICVQAVAEELVSQGCKVNIATLFNAKGQPAVETINGVTVSRVDAGLIETALFNNEDKTDPKQVKKRKRVLKLSKLNGLFRAFSYPLLSKKQVKNLFVKAEEIYREEKIDYCVVVYHKIADVLAGIKLKKKHPDIKLILYTLDAISGGWVPTIMRSKKIPMNSLKRWERFFFKNIDKTFAMESHRKYYESDGAYDKYKDKIEYLDIPLLQKSDEKETNKKEDESISLVYTGSMHKDTANPEYLIKLLSGIKCVKIYIYGNVSDEIKEVLKKLPEYNERLFLMGRKEHAEIGKIQQSADVLLNFGNANPNMIPCKIFEYISTGKKIISFTHSDKDSSLPYMEKYPLALIVKEDDGLIEENVNSINGFIKGEKNNADYSSLEKIFIKNTPKYFCDRLRKL